MSTDARCDFTFDGKTIPAREGQTVGGALHAAGRHVLSRSFKYHRPRGLFCVSGRCPNCMCTVDGEPNVRVCTLPARSGIVVKSQNRWPSVNLDLLSIFDKMDRFMPVGFYYKRMYKPRWMWPVWEKIVRRIAGLGSIDRAQGHAGEYDKLNLFTDVAVVGGGWAGLHAAFESAGSGASVTLIDEQTALGGHLRHDTDLVRAAAGFPELLASVTSHPRIRVLTSAVAFGCYEGNYLGIQQGKRLIRLRAEQVIIATGGWERPFVFENNDLPGVLLASGVQRLLHLDAARLEGEAVVVTDNAQGYRAAAQLKAAGTAIAALIELRSTADPLAATLLPGVRILTGHTLLAARGRGHVAEAIVAAQGGQPESVPCRWIVQAVGWTPANALLYQNGCKLRYDPKADHAIATSYAPGMHSAGAVNGTHDLVGVATESRIAAHKAASAVHGKQPDSRLAELEQARAACHPSPAGARQYVCPSRAKKKFVCLCEDVTEKDVRDAIDEGYANIETLKRYSTVSMGPCQGKMCQAAAVAICADQNGKSIEETGVTTARPPEQPVPMGVLAGRAVHLSLTRRTAMHRWHEENGAAFMDAGAWKRPERYGWPEEEYTSVRSAAGLIDVSTLGKIGLRGSDVVSFLEFIYPNRFANLKVGSVRYGLICDDAGIILDDGTISRLGEARYFLTTTTGNAEAIDSWLRWWLAARPQWDVTLTNVSGSYAAMNLAGPRAREILTKLTDADLSTANLPYLAARQIQIAGVAAIVLRIGFVGELGYEIHVPTQYGLHVWTAIMHAGRSDGLVPFGIEAQRRLRLEKKHILPGTDTDALSNPIEADLGWIIKLEKPDFIGRASLIRAQARGERNKLVGFRLQHDRVPPDNTLILRNGKLAGRLTSSRYSPAAGAVIGLAWVAADSARDGEKISIQVDGQLLTGTVHEPAFYDPAGEKLKS